MKRAALATFTLVATFMSIGGTGWADATTTICVPQANEQPVLSSSTGKCAQASYKAVQLPGKHELETLSKVVPHLSYIQSGVGGKPTVRFSGVNVQIVDGAGNTFAVNGEGNLVIGYNESRFPVEDTGSHNLILGEEQTYTSWGGIVAGQRNAITAPLATVTGGRENAAGGKLASVTGGERNIASGISAAVSGGEHNYATAGFASILGGAFNVASGDASAIAGGGGNQALSDRSAISGGTQNRANSFKTWIGGGSGNETDAWFAAIFGGKELTARNEFEAIP